MIKIQFIPWWENNYFDKKLEYSIVNNEKSNLYILLPVFKNNKRKLINLCGEVLVIDNFDNRFKEKDIIKFIKKERMMFLKKWTFVDKSVEHFGIMNKGDTKIWIEEGQHDKLYLKDNNIK